MFSRSSAFHIPHFIFYPPIDIEIRHDHSGTTSQELGPYINGICRQLAALPNGFTLAPKPVAWPFTHIRRERRQISLKVTRRPRQWRIRSQSISFAGSQHVAWFNASASPQKLQNRYRKTYQERK
jgi:hypothetical protein